MRIVRFVVIILAIVWLGAEVAAIPTANRLIEQRVAERSRGFTAVRSSVGSFPIVTRFLITGRVNRVRVTLVRVARLRLTFEEVRFELDRVQLDRNALLKQKIRIKAIDQGSVTAVLDAGALGAALRAASLSGNVSVSGRTLIVGGESFDLASDILPCDPTARTTSNQVILSCTFTHVPSAIFEVAQGG